MGTLYIVGTPIGNLGDFSPRAIEILKTVDFIAAEDTRVTLKLLNHFEIRNTLISYHEHNAAARGPELLERLLNGENGAIVTDAGMPCISDPGEVLVEDVRARRTDSAREALDIAGAGEIAVVADPTCALLPELYPAALVDAILAKKNLGTKITDAPASQSGI